MLLKAYYHYGVLLTVGAFLCGAYACCQYLGSKQARSDSNAYVRPSNVPGLEQRGGLDMVLKALILVGVPVIFVGLPVIGVILFVFK